MLGTLDTNGQTISGTSTELEDFDLIRYSVDSPELPVSLAVTSSGILDLSDELGAVPASVSASDFGNRITTGGGSNTLYGGAGDDWPAASFVDTKIRS